MRIYLAGPIFQCGDDECIDWRRQMKQRLSGHVILDPMDRDYRDSTDENFREIVEQDKADIDTCDILLVNHQKPSVGTSMEVLYAWERKKNIIIISKNAHISPWLLYHATRIVRSVDDAVSCIESGTY